MWGNIVHQLTVTDEAFVRRMHFTVEFPYPEEEDRRRCVEGLHRSNTRPSSSIG